jgi:hypothetical protein
LPSFITLGLLTHYSVAFVSVAAILSPLFFVAADNSFRTV